MSLQLLSESVSEKTHCPFCIPELFPKEGEKPLALIFLDIDFVLIGNRSKYSLSNKIRSSIEKMVPAHERSWSELQWRTAAAEHLAPDAVENLLKLFNAASKTHSVWIVLSSSWRNDGTLKQIREDMFKTQFFQEYIIGKTSPGAGDTWAPEYSKDSDSCIKHAEDKYGIKLWNRADEIEYWLKDHQVTSVPFVILDDFDDGLSKKFPKNFVKIDYLLEEQEVAKALSCLGIELEE